MKLYAKITIIDNKLMKMRDKVHFEIDCHQVIEETACAVYLIIR